MDRLQEYLTGEYIGDKKLYNSVNELIRSVMHGYQRIGKYGWPYEFRNNYKEANSLSTSTTAIIAFSLAVLLGSEYDLGVENKKGDYIDDHSPYIKILNQAIDMLVDNYSATVIKDDNGVEQNKDKNTFISASYGKNDPLTYMWVKCLLNDKLIEKIVGQSDPDKSKSRDDMKKVFNEKCIEKIRYVFKVHYENREELRFSDDPNDPQKPGPLAKDHMFPLLKIAQLYYHEKKLLEDSKLLGKDNTLSDIDQKYISAIKNTFFVNLHHHLSLECIANSSFDAAEMVFALEGFLLLDKENKHYDKNLLDRFFKVIEKHQQASMYWRPLKPFVVKSQGFALLPISAEIAMSLIRICILLGETGDELFSKNLSIFKKYTEWLLARINTVSITDKEKTVVISGWCSEHVEQRDVIHTWATAQILTYLHAFNKKLEENIANTALKYANLKCDKFNKINSQKNDEKWEICKSLFNEKDAADLEKYYIHNKKEESEQEKYRYSMLLYGPPGTGKTTIAEAVAVKNGWSLITITPSDFIASGVDQVETKAKNIFAALEEQQGVVILFDEIDRLILDRDSKAYQEQSDIFQFMTPSMLVKINDLRKKERVIFIINTNYKERIDKAIKRPGRIDGWYLILPPNKEKRELIINELYDKAKAKANVKVAVPPMDMKKAVKETVLCIYKEIKQYVDEALKPASKNKNKTKPTITLSSYEGRVMTDDFPEKPEGEFLELVRLVIEAESSLSKEDKRTIIQYFDKVAATKNNKKSPKYAPRNNYDANRATVISHLKEYNWELSDAEKLCDRLKEWLK